MSTEGCTVLLVDDDEVFRRRLARALEDRGHTVRTAADADSAVVLARAESPELAVVDLRMPGRSGLELVRDLVAIDATTRVLVLTGYGSIATAVDAMRLGACHYLAKPVDADELLAAFERAGLPGRSAPPLAGLSELPTGAVAETSPTAPSLARAEWEHIQRVLSDCDGNISEAARRLAMHRRSLQRKLQKYPPAQ